MCSDVSYAACINYLMLTAGQCRFLVGSSQPVPQGRCQGVGPTTSGRAALAAPCTCVLNSGVLNSSKHCLSTAGADAGASIKAHCYALARMTKGPVMLCFWKHSACRHHASHATSNSVLTHAVEESQVWQWCAGLTLCSGAACLGCSSPVATAASLALTSLGLLPAAARPFGLA